MISSTIFEKPWGRIKIWSGGSGRCLLLLHGAWGDAQMHWSCVWDELAKHFKVIAPDIPGWGESELRQSFSSPNVIEALAEIVRNLECSKLIVVGNSFGGGVAQVFASSYPELMEKIVLVDCGLINKIPLPISRILAFKPIRFLPQKLLEYNSYSLNSLKRSFYSLGNLSEKQLDQILAGRSVHAALVIQAMLSIEREIKLPNVPTYLIWGEADELVPLKVAQNMIKDHPNWGLFRISKAGHLPQRENPAEFVSAIRRV